MSGRLRHSPASILCQLLINKGWVKDDGTSTGAHLTSGPTAYVNEEQDSNDSSVQDSCVILHDTTGRLKERTQPDGAQFENFGVMLHSRAMKQSDAFDVINEVDKNLSENVKDFFVRMPISGVGTANYNVHMIQKVSGPILLSRSSINKRWYFSLNVLVDVKLLSVT